VGDDSSPVIFDWNEDGNKDLIVGNRIGEVRIYLNKGTNSTPIFENHKKLVFRSHRYCSPEVFDFNQDGYFDLLIGDETGHVFYYQNIGTNEEPKFSNKTKIKADDTEIDVLKNACIDLVDWNKDGFKDLIVGGQNGFITTFYGQPSK